MRPTSISFTAPAFIISRIRFSGPICWNWTRRWSGLPASAVPRRIRPNAGDVYVRSESPRGEIGFYVISDGSATPYRVKARSPAFVNLSVCPEICKGYMIADVVAIVGSIDIVLGEVDR